MIRIKVYEDGKQIQALSLDKTNLIIGRESTADVQLQSDAISRRHARLQKVGSDWQIGDLGAANGVYLVRGENDPRRIVVEPVTSEDVIIIGTYSIQIAEMDGPALSGNWKSEELEDHSVDPSKRTQFISMVDVLEASEGVSSSEGAAEEAKETGESNEGQHLENDSSTWRVRLTSDAGHDRTFEITSPVVSVGSGDDCDIQLPTGPSRIVELDRVGPAVSLRKVTTWPFPRVTYDGRSVKTAVLQHGEYFSVGELQVMVLFESPDGSAE